MNSKTHPHADAKLRARLLLARAAPDDRLMLADATMLAALDGARALTLNERRALAQSPLTLRRFRQLSLERRRGARDGAELPLERWRGSAGMLRAAAGGPLRQLGTDDACWSLHFLAQGTGWQVVLKLAPGAPFAARLMRERPLLRVLDGAGATVLSGRLDADGEYEQGWPFEEAPAPHFQRHGAAFGVEPVAP